MTDAPQGATEGKQLWPTSAFCFLLCSPPFSSFLPVFALLLLVPVLDPCPCFLLSAFCFLLSAFCFLLSAFCFLLSAFCFLDLDLDLDLGFGLDLDLDLDLGLWP